MSAAKLDVLTIGVGPKHWSVPTHPEMKSGAFDPATLGPQLAQMQKDLAASPYACTSYFCGPEEDVSEIAAKLQEKEWKGVVIGWGVRSHPDLTPFFESLIHLTHKYAPNAVICFNTSPGSTVESLRRNLPVA